MNTYDGFDPNSMTESQVKEIYPTAKIYKEKYDSYLYTGMIRVIIDIDGFKYYGGAPTYSGAIKCAFSSVEMYHERNMAQKFKED